MILWKGEGGVWEICIKEQHYKVNFISVFWIGIGICQFYMNVLQIMSTPNRKNHNEIIFF